MDSRFDPSELAFCLEGMLLIRRDAVAITTFDRVMVVLRTAQEKGAVWRSETPMLYQDKGAVLFPVSVEAVNGILASFALFDGRSCIHNSVASPNIDLVKRYWRWLIARKATVGIDNDDLVGWHSEHVNDRNLIHLWETSQVVEFLVNFRDQLKRHVARMSLSLAACSYKPPKKPGPIEIDSKEERTPSGKWKAATKSMEPVTFMGKSFKIYDQIGQHFVDPRVRAKKEEYNPSYSMLLYGPPGTGKTTVAASLSWALEFPLITITVSDFLANGNAAIEARAKDLFDMLAVQPRSIVLFDEIDQFMLDRDSEYFREQETIFQFLTPGMLTKLNDLRSTETIIFIMATNYAERIDSAIKRQGRIDKHFLLLPPDKKRRKKMFKKIWKTGHHVFDEAAEKSVFLGYSDIESVLDPFKLKGCDDLDRNDLISALKSMPAAASPKTYRPRFRNKKDDHISEIGKIPALEFCAMVGLELDAQGISIRSKKWESVVKEKYSEFFNDDILDKIKEEYLDSIF